MLTGQIAGPLAEQLGGVRPAAWYSLDGYRWMPAAVDAPESLPVEALDIGPVFEFRGDLMAFGNGRLRGTDTMAAVRFLAQEGGISWTVTEDTGIPLGVYITEVIAGGPGLVAVGYMPGAFPTQAVVLTSADGVTWLPPSGDPSRLTPIAYGQFSAVASNGEMMVAVGATFSDVTAQPTGAVWTSTNGVDWVQQSEPDEAFAFPNDVIAFGGGFVAVGFSPEGPAAWWSSDGSEWTPADIPRSGEARGASAVTEASGVLVAIGDFSDHASAWTSVDGRTWTAQGDLSFSANAQLVIPFGRSVLAAGNTYPVREPVIWISPSDTVPDPAPRPTPVPDPPVAHVTGQTPTPEATPHPGGLPFSDLTLVELRQIAGAIGMTCESYPATIPDSPYSQYVMSCSATRGGAVLTMQTHYWSLTAIGGAIFTIITSRLPDRGVVDHALVEFAQLSFYGAQPEVTEDWMLANAYRTDCLFRSCELVSQGAYAFARILLQVGNWGSLQVEYIPVQDPFLPSP